MLQTLILINTLSSACWEGEKKKTETASVLCSKGQPHLAGYAMRDFHSC
jgi:hypothetical protein